MNPSPCQHFVCTLLCCFSASHSTAGNLCMVLISTAFWFSICTFFFFLNKRL